jgi:hypothetical protein
MMSKIKPRQHEEYVAGTDLLYNLKKLRSLNRTLEKIIECFEFPYENLYEGDEADLVSMTWDAWQKIFEIIPTVCPLIGIYLNTMQETLGKIYDHPPGLTMDEEDQVKNATEQDWEQKKSNSDYTEEDMLVFLTIDKILEEDIEGRVVKITGKTDMQKVTLVDPKHFNKNENWDLLCDIISDNKREGVPCENERTLRSLKERLKACEKTHGTLFGYEQLAKSLRWKNHKAYTTLPSTAILAKSLRWKNHKAYTTLPSTAIMVKSADK